MKLRKTTITAVVIALAAALWLGSGVLGGMGGAAKLPSLAEMNERAGSDQASEPPTEVRARTIRAERRPDVVKVRGRTRNKRTVEVRAETTGRVVARPVERGDRVAEGDLLCRIAIENREATLTQAQAAASQAQIEYRGSLRLQDRGLQSETAIAQAKSRLATAQAQLQAAVLDMERTRIRAPFAGVVEATRLEVGDFAQAGAPCAAIVDLDPMLLVGRVSEADVHRLAPGATAVGRLATGATAAGPISFVGSQADPDTRMYEIEVTVPNADFALRSGVTTEIEVAVGEVEAHKISPAVLALDDEGRIGARIVADDRVRFARVQVIADDADGVWVAGLPRVVTLITVGQQFVVEGERVQVRFEEAGGASAQRAAR